MTTPKDPFIEKIYSWRYGVLEIGYSDIVLNLPVTTSINPLPASLWIIPELILSTLLQPCCNPAGQHICKNIYRTYTKPIQLSEQHRRLRMYEKVFWQSIQWNSTQCHCFHSSWRLCGCRAFSTGIVLRQPNGPRF